ncbi:manganese-dependent ADP-ribose/CDP-alcohol diphosphatase-like [Hyperolius riggenbachi]|uniref:manganese-dependent ADP-ribose/CDP-alcohol diphosphatase-like n=1 Tax=Hyperolius riggenbachi TaxID=752182 RepID=UPI0035A31996
MEEHGEVTEDLKDQKPHFSFGVIADIQYANKPNGPSHWKTMRYYQQSLHHLQEAIEEWNQEEPPPQFVLQLGDIIDSFNRRYGLSQEALGVVLKHVSQAKMPFHHIWGNHELYNFNRDSLRESRLNTEPVQEKQGDECGGSHSENPNNADYYAYHFSPHSKFCFILVDTYDLSVLGRRQDCQRYLDSWDFVDQVMEDQNGLDDRHLVEFNGGMGAEQLSWLDERLGYCDRHDERAIVAGHVPVHPKAKRSDCLAWNYRDILRVLQSHRSVVAYFAGHDHSGGYHLDSRGIHHITMEGVVESPPDSNAFGTVDVYEDRMVLRGRGRVRSRHLMFSEKRRLEEPLVSLR